MRRLLLLLLLLCPVPAWAQFTLVGQDYEECTSSASCTFGTGVTAAAGDLIVVLVANRDNATVSSVSDGVNTGYTCPTTLQITNASSVMTSGCYFINSGAGTVTPVVTHSASSRPFMSFQVWRPTGTVTLDAEVEGTNTAATTHVTPTLSTGANAALVVCGHGLIAALTDTAGSGYTGLTTVDPSRLAAQYDITSVSSGSFTCDMTTTSTNSASIGVSFNDSGGGATCAGGLMLMGAGKCD
jgi:hypothetical protein